MHVFDPLTAGCALDRYFTGLSWRPYRGIQSQTNFLQWVSSHSGDFSDCPGSVNVVAPVEHINSTMARFGCEHAFTVDAVGSLSIFDATMPWTDTASSAAKRFFTASVRSYSVIGYDSPLMCLTSKYGDSLWLIKLPLGPAIMARLALEAQWLLDFVRTSGVRPEVRRNMRIPQLDLGICADLGWFSGMSVSNGTGVHFIAQAHQCVKLAVNASGANVKVATGLIAKDRTLVAPYEHELSKQWLGFFTQRGRNLPIAVWAF